MEKTVEKLRHRFSEPLRVEMNCSGPSRTQQQFKDECDINKIMEKYRKTGILGKPGLNKRFPMYGDFSSGADMHEMQNKLISANEDFMRLPSAVRSRFGNEPAALIDFMANPENREEAIELGLVDRPRRGKPREKTPEKGGNEAMDKENIGGGKESAGETAHDGT